MGGTGGVGIFFLSKWLKLSQRMEVGGVRRKRVGGGGDRNGGGRKVELRV